MLSRFAAFSARQVRSDQPTGPAVISVVLTAAYLVPVLVVAVWQGQPWQEPLHWAAGSPFLRSSAAWGAAGRSARDSPRAGRPGPGRCRARSWRPSWSCWPAGAGVLVTGLVCAPGSGDPAAGVLGPADRAAASRCVAQLAVVPNVIVWAASYALGSGFVLGAGSVVAPAGDRAGHAARHPAARRPALGRPGQTRPNCGGWRPGPWPGRGGLGVVRSCRLKRFDPSSLIGGLAGLLAGPCSSAWPGPRAVTWATCAWPVWARGWCRCW